MSESAAAAAAAAGEDGYGGGAGGKFRRRPLRKTQATPYDRPPTAARGIRATTFEPPAGAAGRNGWLSRLVDPASRLITRGATKFFSSVFQKRLGGPPPPTDPPAETSCEVRQDAPDSVSPEPLPKLPVGGSKDDCKSEKVSEDDGISGLEQLLKQKTFTRAEFDHLTKLLRSRTVDLPEEAVPKKAFEPKTLLPADNYKNDVNIILGHESEIEDPTFGGVISTPVKVPGEEIASPAEVAKAYMGSMPTKMSVSSSSLRNQLIRGSTSSPSFVGFSPKPSAGSLSLRSVNRIPGFSGPSENGIVASRPRGRSAIYKMSRSPYFKGPSTSTLKAGGLIEDGSSGPSTSNQRMPISAFSGDRQVLKRRSSVIESDIGSFGPIRRIRQKSNLASPSKEMTMTSLGKLPTTVASNSSQPSTFSSLLALTPEPTSDVLHWNSTDSINDHSGDLSVPRQSTEMAQKILQQLCKMVPSPKEKPSEAKVTSMHETPPKLTLSMLHGQALKSVIEIDSSKSFSVNTNGKVDAVDSSPPGSLLPPKMIEVQVNGPSKASPSELKIDSKTRGLESNLASVADGKPIKEHSSSIFQRSAVGLLQKKPAFTMQAPEGSFELEDESNSRDDASGSLAPHMGKKEASKGEPKILTSEAKVTKKPFSSFSESKVGSDHKLGKDAGKREAGEGVTDRLNIPEKNIGFTFQVPPSQAQPPLTPVMASPAIEKSVPMSEPSTAPTFTFGSKTSSLAFPSDLTSLTEPASLKFGLKADSKGPLFGSSVTGTVANSVGSESIKSYNRADDFLESAGAPSSSAMMTSTTSSTLFTSTAPSNLSNGSPSSTTSIFSASAAAPLPSPFSSSTGGIFSSTSASGSTSSGASIAPSTSSAKTFQFGAVSGVSTNLVTSTLQSSSAKSGREPDKELTPGVMCSAASTSSSMNTGTLGFGASASSSASGTAGSIFGTQVLGTGSGNTPFAQSLTNHFGSSSSSVFGLGGSLLGFSTSAFGSTMSSAKPLLTSSSAFGQSSTSSVAVADSGASSSSFASTATSPTLFGSSSQSTASPVFGSIFGSSSSTSSMFTPASSSASATVLFGSSSTSPLNFSSTAPATSSASAATLFGASSSSPLASKSSAPATSASGTAVFGVSSSSPLAFSSSTPAATSPFAFTQTTAVSSSGNSFPSFGSTMSSASLAPAVSAFGIPTPAVGFGSASPGNDQMNVEDSMADDTVHSTMASVPSFGQTSNNAVSNMPFGSPATPSGGAMFQFASPQPSSFPQSPFQATGSFEFGGGFSIGSGGGDKSGRRFVKAKRDKHRKK